MNNLGEKLTTALRKSSLKGLTEVQIELCRLNATGKGWMVTRPNGSSVSVDGQRVFDYKTASDLAFMVSKELHG